MKRLEYLVIHTPSENADLLAALPADGRFLRDIQHRMSLLMSFSADEEVCSMSFRCDCQLYEAPDTDLVLDTRLVAKGDTAWSFVDCFELATCGDRIQLECEPNMVLSKYGMWITAKPKHWNETVESAFICNDDLKDILSP